MQATLPSQVFHIFGVYDPELEPELLLHLGPPFFLEGGWAKDKNGPSTMAKQHLLND